MLRSKLLVLRCLVGLNVDKFATLFACCEHNNAIDEGEKGVVFAHTHVETGMMYSSALAFDDIAGFASGTAIDLHSESFAF